VLNAGKQINRGVEIESVWRPIKPATFALNIGYLDSYYKDFLISCFAGTPTSPPVNVADQNRPLNAPAWTVSGNITYTWDLAPGALLARAGYGLAQLHQGREYHSKCHRSAGVWTAQRRHCVHYGK